MSIAEHAAPDPDRDLPEAHLLRDSDRLGDYAGAFLRGEITAAQYSELALAEIQRRAPLDPLLPLGDPEPAPPVAVEEPLPALSSDDDRSRVLAGAFVTGRISAPTFLRLVRET